MTQHTFKHSAGRPLSGKTDDRVLTCPVFNCGYRGDGKRRMQHFRRCHMRLLDMAMAADNVGAADTLYELSHSDFLSETLKVRVLHRAYETVKRILTTRRREPGASQVDASQSETGERSLGPDNATVCVRIDHTHKHIARLNVVRVSGDAPHLPSPSRGDDGSPLLADDIEDDDNAYGDCHACADPVISMPMALCQDRRHVLHPQCAFDWVSRSVLKAFRPDLDGAVQCAAECYALKRGRTTGGDPMEIYSDMGDIKVVCPCCRSVYPPLDVMAYWHVCRSNGMVNSFDMDWCGPPTPPNIEPDVDAMAYETPSVILDEAADDVAADPDFVYALNTQLDADEDIDSDSSF